MNEREQISALVDGELGPAERDALLARLEREPELAQTWRRYQLSHAALQHEAPSATDLSARVMAALADEPVILAPKALPDNVATHPHWWRKAWVRTAGGMALAASVTFGLMSVMQTSTPAAPESTGASRDLQALYQAAAHPEVLVSPDSGDAAVPQVAMNDVNDNDRENAYMLAHAEYSERGLQDGIVPFARVAGQAEDY